MKRQITLDPTSAPELNELICAVSTCFCPRFRLIRPTLFGVSISTDNDQKTSRADWGSARARQSIDLDVDAGL